MDRTRRRVLGLSASALTVGIAGCGKLGSEENEPNSAPPNWQRWAPSAAVVNSDALLVKADIQQTMAEFPEFYDTFDVTVITDALGIEDSTLSNLITVAGEEYGFTVLLGDFELETVLESLQGEPTEEYRGYRIFQDRGFAINAGVVVVADDIHQLIDTYEDESGYLGDGDDDWNTILPYLTDSAFGAAQTGLPNNANIPLAPERTVAYMEPLDSATGTATIRLQYSSEGTAEEAWAKSADDNLETLFSSAVELSDSKQQARQIVAEGQGPKEDIANL